MVKNVNSETKTQFIAGQIFNDFHFGFLSGFLAWRKVVLWYLAVTPPIARRAFQQQILVVHHHWQLGAFERGPWREFWILKCQVLWGFPSWEFFMFTSARDVGWCCAGHIRRFYFWTTGSGSLWICKRVRHWERTLRAVWLGDLPLCIRSMWQCV